MKVNFLSGIVVDTDNIPADFDTIILEAFKEYTSGTSPVYMYHDKLSFIDCCVKYLHKAHDANNAVKALILEDTEWQLDEYGELPDPDEFWSLDFMATCYENGRDDASLYAHYTGDRRIDDAIMTLLARAIKVVMNYGGDTE